MDLFVVFYNSGSSFNECLAKGPGELKQILSDCSTEELGVQARRLAIPGRQWHGLEPARLAAVIVERVLAVVTHGREFGDY